LSNEVRRRIIGVIDTPFEKLQKSLLMSLHQEAFNLNYCVTCRSEQILAYIELTRLIRPKKMSKYTFKAKHKNSRLMVKGVGIVTAETLTDAIAKKLLSRGIYNDLIVEVAAPKKAKKPSAKKA
tara:strand:+ start:179 stop:550 length:372 start_codon:yes stop_codon:yes gene_type:complete